MLLFAVQGDTVETYLLPLAFSWGHPLQRGRLEVWVFLESVVSRRSQNTSVGPWKSAALGCPYHQEKDSVRLWEKSRTEYKMIKVRIDKCCNLSTWKTLKADICCWKADFYCCLHSRRGICLKSRGYHRRCHRKKVSRTKKKGEKLNHNPAPLSWFKVN